MRRIRLLAFALWNAAALARAGVGVWTATASAGAATVVVGPDGSVYTDWGGSFSLQIARSTNHGLTWQPFPGPGRVGASFLETRVLAIDAVGTIYAAFNTGGNASFHADLHVSRDGGGT